MGKGDGREIRGPAEYPELAVRKEPSGLQGRRLAPKVGKKARTVLDCIAKLFIEICLMPNIRLAGKHQCATH